MNNETDTGGITETTVDLMLTVQNSMVELNCQLLTEISESDNISDNVDRIKICSKVDQMFEILNTVL